MVPTQKTVLITGCTQSSIGYMLAKEFASLNYKVYATARKISNMADLGATKNITLLALDVSSPESITAVRDQIASETNGTLDILYHNAGYRTMAMATETSLEDSRKIFDANLLGIIEMNRQFADIVIASKGSIVFTSSLAAFMPHPSQSVYCASKAALHIYAGALRIEMKPFGVKVVLVNTGVIKTAMASQRMELSSGSRYKYLESKINQAWDVLDKGQTTPEEYARYVVGKVTRSNAQVIWAGSHSWVVWFAEHLNLGWVYDIHLSRLYGLNAAAPTKTK
ncbi:NAD(P)-binding protein [Aspergillus lucknowensis]|uniref:NAD(P)-binding protein n=1 Tax=Aspergillus lucknowensis TaxID=176173 RepID=A0ABR4M3V3_9EURO